MTLKSVRQSIHNGINIVKEKPIDILKRLEKIKEDKRLEEDRNSIGQPSTDSILVKILQSTINLDILGNDSQEEGDSGADDFDD